MESGFLDALENRRVRLPIWKSNWRGTGSHVATVEQEVIAPIVQAAFGAFFRAPSLGPIRESEMSRKVRVSTQVAKDNAAAAVKLSADTKRALASMEAAIKALADAIDALDDRLDRIEPRP
jgi:hypothetical protein